MKRIATFLVLCSMPALPALGDIKYTARTWQEGAESADIANMTVEAWVDGDRCDVRFRESGNPFMPEGTRLVCRNEAREIYLVNDQEQTYSKWQLDALMESLNTVMKSMGPMMKIQVENAKVETLLQEPGGLVAGYPTTRYRFRTTYDMTLKMMGMGQTQHVDSVQEGWYTTELDDVALGIWLMRDPPDFGDTGLAELIELEKQKVKGFPLKTVIEQTTVNKKGRESVTRTITEVTDISRGSAPAGTYGWPSNYREIQPAIPAEMMGQEDEEKKGGLKGLFKRGGG